MTKNISLITITATSGVLSVWKAEIRPLEPDLSNISEGSMQSENSFPCSSRGIHRYVLQIRGCPEDLLYQKYLRYLKQKKPVIHVLTNTVTSHFVADALLILGCRPVMGYDPSEVKEITSRSDGLAINTGTPHSRILRSYRISLKIAAKKRIPAVIDFPGAGLSKTRMKTAKDLMKILRKGSVHWKRVLRGNGSEIYSLACGKSMGGTIESIHDPRFVAGYCGNLTGYAQAVCISGPVNSILGYEGPAIPGGSPLMAETAGFGCISSALMAAFLSCSGKDFPANPAPGESAAAVCRLFADVSDKIPSSLSPVSFRHQFLKELYGTSESCKGESL